MSGCLEIFFKDKRMLHFPEDSEEKSICMCECVCVCVCVSVCVGVCVCLCVGLVNSAELAAA